MDDDGHGVRAALANKKTDGVIQGLREALIYKGGRHEPWTSGVMELFHDATTLFYEQQDGTPSSLKLGSVTPVQAENLSRACAPATFGLNHQDVLDETYRKAGKLDADKIGWNFNPDFLDYLVSGLFPWCSLSKGIRCELYKLNVYGEGSFFKAHQDTPRSEDMFGSLVVLLPIEHEGGNLRLVHRDREFIFDGQALLKGATATSIAYVAFFSDVEHEVTRVTSGHRVTITFNLYFDSRIGPPLLQTPAAIEHPFKTALAEVLQSPAIKAAHQYLGFGLEHAYPFKKVIKDPGSIELKGSDAILVQTLNELDVPHRFLLAYREDERNTCPFRILSGAIVEGHDFSCGDTDMVTLLADTPGSFFVRNKRRKRSGNTRSRYSEWVEYAKDYNQMDVDWVTEPSEEFLDRSPVIAYGNEPSLEYQYHQLCVIACLAMDENSKDLAF